MHPDRFAQQTLERQKEIRQMMEDAKNLGMKHLLTRGIILYPAVADISKTVTRPRFIRE